ncbi:acyl-CoA carboxylase subunit epsilon [Saccharopolyspora dendranthemae]|uniref:Acyl-CoA carboxylase epsilon subunit-like protein n=1 Tax=Saccharopolyspora dendranthemae TaxID=1181886 RepID=A0A561V795_9PSEU|nr:acyl-CoA carboxylase subunit epsilon [Saccharopolyspora dendranthemae]TWG07463.1 acyl-CoA carboxylase epsilon subunit-like protein [Saccharopolyspora dendranthemae]
MSEETPQRPVLRIVRGEPDDVEIAALTAALAGASAARAPEEESTPLSLWGDPVSAVRHPAGRRPLRPGPHAWRASGMPG